MYKQHFRYPDFLGWETVQILDSSGFQNISDNFICAPQKRDQTIDLYDLLCTWNVLLSGVARISNLRSWLTTHIRHDVCMMVIHMFAFVNAAFGKIVLRVKTLNTEWDKVGIGCTVQ